MTSVALWPERVALHALAKSFGTGQAVILAILWLYGEKATEPSHKSEHVERLT
jgi:hypothetical protein